MNKLEFRRIQIRDEDAFLRATSLWDYSSGYSWTKPSEGQTFAAFVRELEDQEQGRNLPPNYVPATVFYGFVDDEIVGRVSVRHELNDFLLKIGGHIGYGVVPPHRNKGYATKLLAAALPECRKLGITRALLTCNVDNVASAKVIEKNGGQLENIFEPEAGSGHTAKKRYWISL